MAAITGIHHGQPLWQWAATHHTRRCRRVPRLALCRRYTMRRDNACSGHINSLRRRWRSPPTRLGLAYRTCTARALLVAVHGREGRTTRPSLRVWLTMFLDKEAAWDGRGGRGRDQGNKRPWHDEPMTSLRDHDALPRSSVGLASRGAPPPLYGHTHVLYGTELLLLGISCIEISPCAVLRMYIAELASTRRPLCRGASNMYRYLQYEVVRFGEMQHCIRAGTLHGTGCPLLRNVIKMRANDGRCPPPGAGAVLGFLVGGLASISRADLSRFRCHGWVANLSAAQRSSRSGVRAPPPGMSPMCYVTAIDERRRGERRRMREMGEREPWQTTHSRDGIRIRETGERERALANHPFQRRHSYLSAWRFRPWEIGFRRLSCGCSFGSRVDNPARRVFWNPRANGEKGPSSSLRSAWK
ncbi:hypothetical protein BKA56DRAFT_48854 [Ilyonectria sp. MPI-CAGE-AT-0026]|nr:hypothetical protein BKA56DRAFT_48854 [Ilyonectria sp. MPI-CAGE-AT-0026]